MNVAYSLYVKEFQLANEPLLLARDRAAETFMTEEELRRKQNAETLKKLGVRRT